MMQNILVRYDRSIDRLIENSSAGGLSMRVPRDYCACVQPPCRRETERHTEREIERRFHAAVGASAIVPEEVWRSPFHSAPVQITSVCVPIIRGPSVQECQVHIFCFLGCGRPGDAGCDTRFGGTFFGPATVLYFIQRRLTSKQNEECEKKHSPHEPALCSKREGG